MKKIFSTALAAILAASLFAGCSKDNGGSTASADFTPSMNTDETLTIEVRGSWSNFEALEAASIKWNEYYPNVTINYSKVDNFNNQIEALASNDNPPEIIMLNTYEYYSGIDNVADMLVDLSEIGLDTSIFDDSITEASKINGRFCILNWAMVASGFVVNKTLLDEYGLEIPKTHEEFDAVCSALLEKGYTPIQGCTDSICRNILKNECDYDLANADNSAELYEKLSTGAAGCGEAFLKEFSSMIELTEKGYISTAANAEIADIYEGSILHFFEGSTPFLAFTTEGVSGMKKRETKSEHFSAEPFEYEFVSLPVCSEEPVLSVSTAEGFGILKNSANAEWAKEFLRFLCNTGEINEMAEVKGMPAITKTGIADKRFDEIAAIPAERRVNPDKNIISVAVYDCLNETFGEIANGSITTPEAAQTYFEEALDKLV